LSAEPEEIIPGVWTTGEITLRPEPQGSSEQHCVREGGAYVPDPYRDDMALVLAMDDRLVLLCGCCHAGLLNTLAHVRRAFERPVVAIAGGLHLANATADCLQRVGEVLIEMESVQHVYPSHCSGEAAFVSLTLALGPSVVSPCPAGTALAF
jgi:7,8-dihydropterin-6-yl-methyl-4-(beta-D-ribofuranosyl)aminobenzene 5'-phosphate synthase